MRTFSVRGATLAPLAHAVAEALFDGALPTRLHGGGQTFEAHAWRRLPEVPGGLLVAEFGEHWLHVDHPTQTVSGNLALPPDPSEWLACLAECPWRSATFGAAHSSWTHRDYGSQHYLPPLGLGGGHIPFGCGAAFRGAGRASLASDRLLTDGPWRTVTAGDAVFLQFHALNADATEALAQAIPGHQLLSTAWLGEAPVLSRNIHGSWFAADRSVRITWAEARAPYGREMMTAVALGRAEARRRPVERVDFVFLEPDVARSAHPDLWLRGLGCRVIDDAGAEVILGAPAIERPAWIN